jgi:hypothetical protein
MVEKRGRSERSPKATWPGPGGSEGPRLETHSQAPIKDGKKFLLKEVEFNEANTTNAGKLGIGCKGVAEGFRSNGDTRNDEPMDGERGDDKMLKTSTDPVNVIEDEE